MFWQILVQFIFRTCLGLAAATMATSPRRVSSGFFRTNCWVLLGLGTFASLILYSRADVFPHAVLLLGLAVSTTLLCYVGAIVWLYEWNRVGRAILATLVALCFLLLLAAAPPAVLDSWGGYCWAVLDVATGSLLLGATFAAMLLGHWYLNSPSMRLDPLRRLLRIMAFSLAARAAICAVGLFVHVAGGQLSDGFSLATASLRWVAGIVGLAVMTWMSWQTLKIPNTQSATGILYVALVFVFLGELASALLSFGSPLPL